mmetsp:Transcript_5371/g.11870  ORF Transcript_5371/g.11870 Transcript_5371/m.11870 type:complete len:214 (+) Transcript_5371:2757-3398(+)
MCLKLMKCGRSLALNTSSMCFLESLSAPEIVMASSLGSISTPSSAIRFKYASSAAFALKLFSAPSLSMTFSMPCAATFSLSLPSSSSSSWPAVNLRAASAGIKYCTLMGNCFSLKPFVRSILRPLRSRIVSRSIYISVTPTASISRCKVSSQLRISAAVNSTILSSTSNLIGSASSPPRASSKKARKSSPSPPPTPAPLGCGSLFSSSLVTIC